MLAVSSPWNVLSLLYLHGLLEGIGFSMQAGLSANLLSKWASVDISKREPTQAALPQHPLSLFIMFPSPEMVVFIC